jgi:uncharacterized membrane protein YjdF
MQLSKDHQLICISNDKLVGYLTKKKMVEIFSYFFFLELSTMYRTMESKNLLTPEEAITALRAE